jgi:transposase
MKTQSNELSFKGENIYVGFDTHLKSWKVTIMTEKLLHKTFTQPPKPELLHNYLVKHFPGGNYYTAYEAGFCGFWIHHKLKSLGVNSIVVNPGDIPTTNKERVQKEDKRDSRKIAKSLRGGDLEPIYVPSVETLEDRSLLRTRTLLVKDLTRNKNRVKSFLHFHGIEIPINYGKDKAHWSNRFIEWTENVKMTGQSGKAALATMIEEVKNLRSSVNQITAKIKLLAQTDEYSNRMLLLRSVPGIGLLTGMILLTEIESIERFKSFDQLCGYIGLIPSTYSSGENDNPGDITPRGHSILRCAIIESAWIAARIDPALAKSYNEYCRRMEPNKAIVRIAKKLLSRIRYVLKNNKEYVYAVVK